MNDELIPEKLYYLRMLNDNLLKEGESQFVIKNVRISPSGVLEADRIYADVKFATKVFYSGEYYITELGPDEVEDFYSDEPHEHHPNDDEE